MLLFFVAHSKDLKTIAKNLNDDQPKIILYHCQNIKGNTCSVLNANSVIIIGITFKIKFPYCDIT